MLARAQTGLHTAKTYASVQELSSPAPVIPCLQGWLWKFTAC